jgi:hypothetical protein
MPENKLIIKLSTLHTQRYKGNINKARGKELSESVYGDQQCSARCNTSLYRYASVTNSAGFNSGSISLTLSLIVGFISISGNIPRPSTKVW